MADELAALLRDMDRLERIARTGDLGEQAALFRNAEALARERGLGAVIDGWEPDVGRLRGECYCSSTRLAFAMPRLRM